jgi:hypothetical protein
VVDACRVILERWAEPADLVVAKVSSDEKEVEPRTASEREPACDGASLPVMDGDTVEMDGDTVERVVSMRELARRIAEQ